MTSLRCETIDVTFEAVLTPALGTAAVQNEINRRDSSRAWCVTHQLGGLAGSTYTRVDFAPGVDMAYGAEIVRQIALDLYGPKWAFLYPPGRPPAEASIREHVTVMKVEVWS